MTAQKTPVAVPGHETDTSWQDAEEALNQLSDMCLDMDEEDEDDGEEGDQRQTCRR